MRRAHGLIVIVFGLSAGFLMLVGCGQSSDETVTGKKTSVNQSTPRATVESFINAFENLDPKAMSGLVDTSNESGQLFAEFFANIVEVSKAQDRFFEKALAKYGSEYAEHLNDMKESFMTAEEVKEMRESLASAEFVEDGDRVTLQMGSSSRDVIHLINKSGKWYIDMEAVSDIDELKGLAKELQVVRRIFDESLIDQQETFEDFRMAFRARMRDAM